MKPAAQLQTVIELIQMFERTLTGEAPAVPADALLNQVFRAAKFIGSHDRRFLATNFYGILRQYHALEWWVQQSPGAVVSARLMVFAYRRLSAGVGLEQLENLCDGVRYHPDPLDRQEHQVLKYIDQQAPRTRDGTVPLVPSMPLWVQGNCPEFILPSLQAQFGDTVLSVLHAQQQEAPLDIRINTLKATRDQVQQELMLAGIESQPTLYSPWGLRIDGRQPLASLPSFKNGWFEVQDEGSQLIAMMVDAPPGATVLDYCAGAGGKTLALAATMQNKGRVIAMDVSATRLKSAQQRLRRAGVSNAQAKLIEDASRSWMKRHHGFFDRVLVDAPCSGSGTWRRNPDLRLRVSPAQLQELQAKQLGILTEAASMVKSGGRLIYATCSLFQEENEHIIDAFLAQRPEYQVMPIQDLWPSLLTASCPTTDQFLRTNPHQHGMDGFFTAVLVRR